MNRSFSSASRCLTVGYAFTVFLSAFLLFQVQPLLSKTILPWFGGTPSVWTTCMLFFQVVLFAGYAYAHWITARPMRTQAIGHIALLCVAALALPISPSLDWKPAADDAPILRIILLLSMTVGLPFFALSATGPLLQRWFSFTHAGRSPYRLYALSNAGSLIALVSYPFVFEPVLPIRTQGNLWSLAFLAVAVLCAGCALAMWSLGRRDVQGIDAEPADEKPSEPVKIPLGTRMLWFGLAMTASVMLLATTNQVCLDVASVPFLWVLPLTLYLLSFILTFDSDRWYARRIFLIALGVSMVTVSTIMLKGAGVTLMTQVLIYFAGLFFATMVCHGELVALKPPASRLTSFYLTIAAGGAAGGIFVGLIAPLWFPIYFEMHVAILGCCALTLLVLYRDRGWILYRGRPRWAWRAMILSAAALAVVLNVHAGEMITNVVTVTRNFYGVIRVVEVDVDQPKKHQRQMLHGRIVHGLQFQSDDKAQEPTTYYGRESGLGMVLSDLPEDQPARVGVVGLGVGTVASFGRPGDFYRYYEINPDVVRLANEYFTFLKEGRADFDVVLGDARLSLERAETEQFDVLILDAFSGDAIPTHLLTVEAFAIYLQHLAEDGLLALHVSNMHFDLRPVVDAAAEKLGLESATILTLKDEDAGTYDCIWMLLARDFHRLSPFQEQFLKPQPRRVLWTDDQSNLFEIIR